MSVSAPRRDEFEIFLACAPGLEATLLDEVRHKGFRRPAAVAGGVTLRGGWPEVWRANLWLRGADRVLARIAQFPVRHLAHHDDLAHRFPWREVLRADAPFRVEATCAASRIFHSGAAAERIARGIGDSLGTAPAPDGTVPAPDAADTDAVTVRARIERDLCTLSIDTSGAPLHRRGHKPEVNAAPLRETTAALLLRQCGFRGEEPLLDPMCGSGTLVLEAAEVAARLNPGRTRGFSFERLASFDAEAWSRMRAAGGGRPPPFRCFGSDRDDGAVGMSRRNAERAGVTDGTEFRRAAISQVEPPEGPPGLVILNPPYGHRLGERDALRPLYQTLGRVLRQRFSGWRVGLLSAVPELARATALPWLPTGAPILHGGLRVTLFRTDPLPPA